MNQPDPTTDRRDRYAAAMAKRDGDTWPTEYENDEADYRRRADAAMAVADAEQAELRRVADGLERDAAAPGVAEIVRPALRDAARQIRAALAVPAAEEQPENETPDLPARLEAALTERFTELGNPFSRMSRREKGPDGWPAEHPVGPHHVAEVLRELQATPPAVVPQPEEA